MGVTMNRVWQIIVGSRLVGFGASGSRRISPSKGPFLGYASTACDPMVGW
jgi:hypothetical protein